MVAGCVEMFEFGSLDFVVLAPVGLSGLGFLRLFRI